MSREFYIWAVTPLAVIAGGLFFVARVWLPVPEALLVVAPGAIIATLVGNAIRIAAADSGAGRSEPTTKTSTSAAHAKRSVRPA